LSSVGGKWMNTGSGNWSSLTSINVGDISFGTNFSSDQFCSNWPTYGFICSTSYSIGATWQVAGLTHWNAESESYITLSSNPTQNFYFDLDNTPINNFCSSEFSNSSMTINGSSVNINDICSLKFGDSYSSVSNIGAGWLAQGNGAFWTNISSIDFSGLSSLSSVGGQWMNCDQASYSKMTSLNFDGLSSLKSVGSYWLSCASSFSSLSSIDFSGLSNLQSVSGYWMCASTSFNNVSSINFNGMSSLKSVGNRWMAGWDSFTSLQSLDFTGLSSLSSVGDDWMHTIENGLVQKGIFTKLTTINFSGLSSLVSVGTNWMSSLYSSFSSMHDIIVGNIAFNFGVSGYCYGWTSTGGVVHGVDQQTCAGWLSFAGFTGWTWTTT